MSKTERIGLTAAGLILALIATVAPARAQARIKAGEERPYSAATPAIYPQGPSTRPVTWTKTVFSPGATFLRIHFQRLNLPDGDYVTISSPNGADVWTYEKKGPLGTGELWSFSVEGDTAIVELHSGRRNGKAGAKRFGLAIDRIAHGTALLDAEIPEEKIVCGTDGRENVACHAGFINPVARLLFQSGGQSFFCTGWLVAGSNASTMLTNNHCVATQAEVSTVQALFNYRYTTCGGSTPTATSTFAGGTFLRTHAGLDYTLLTLQGNPEPMWGELIPTTKTPTVGMIITVPQHPGGGRKTIGFWDNSAHTVRCSVATINATYAGSTAGSQMGYACDTEGGSSGSPIVEAATGRIIGLHHFGGIGGSTCLNSATQMRDICADAGSLLKCQTSSSCIPDGGVDDTLGQTSCCSGVAVNGSTVCLNPADYGNSWASCSHICGTQLVNGCVPSGGTDDTLFGTSCCSGADVTGTTWCLDPADYGTDWTSCVQTCQ